MKLNFPEYNFNIKTEKDVNYVFDIIRKKWLLLTPEEWVRQHTVQFLIQEKQYPASLIALERGLAVHSRKKRFDVLVFNTEGEPVLLVECKRPGVKINQEVFDQIALYNAVFNAKILLVTNGLNHLCVQYNPDHTHYQFLNDIPDFKTLTQSV
jgi:hypothetical protein